MTALRAGLVALSLVSTMLGATGLQVAHADDLTATLQQLIQHSADEQVQAVATHNLPLMADTQTADYYAQLAATYQDMFNQQVTGISLLQIDFGPVTVAPDGASANATTWETWRINSQAGTIDYDPVRNDYVLVLDNGVWKIKSDVQVVGAPTPTPGPPTPTPGPPTSTSTPTPTPTLEPTPTPAPQTERPTDEHGALAGHLSTAPRADPGRSPATAVAATPHLGVVDRPLHHPRQVNDARRAGPPTDPRDE